MMAVRKLAHFLSFSSSGSINSPSPNGRSPGQRGTLEEDEEDEVDLHYSEDSEDNSDYTDLRRNGSTSHDHPDEENEVYHDEPDCGSARGLANGSNSLPVVASKSRTRQNFLRNVPSDANDDRVGHNNGFRCILCGDSFETLNHLEDHKVTHTRTRRYSCPECPKSFYTRSNLTEHLDIHREPKHKCPKCDKVFVQASNLKTHMSSCKKKKSSTPKNSKTSTTSDEDRSLCGYCPKSFKNARDMYKHVRNFHPDQQLVKVPCKLCPKMYYSVALLKAHMQKFHRSEIKSPDESDQQQN